MLSANHVNQEVNWGRNTGGSSFSSNGAISLALVGLFSGSAAGSIVPDYIGHFHLEETSVLRRRYA